ncbi:MAG: ABC transporter permease [Syntrophomonadaceae bacterium]|nr:ABC transporter permease [Syntrophomonadaceae bacterium]
MNNLDLISMSFGNLMRRKTRAILTVLGVVIGTASIVVMLSLGLAMEKSFKDSLASMGSLNTIQVYSGGGYGYSTDQPGQDAKLDDAAVAAFEMIPGVEAVMAEKNTYMKMVSGRMVGGVSIVGINPDVMENFGFEAEEGRLLQSSDKNALVFGKQVAFNFYNPRSRDQEGMMYYGGMSEGEAEPEPPVKLLSGKLMMSSDHNYGEPRRSVQDSDYKAPDPHEVRGVGILVRSNDEKDWNAYMNIKVLEEIIEQDQRATGQRNTRNNQEEKYSTIKVKALDIDKVEGVQEQIKNMGYQAHSLTEILESMQKQSRTIMGILGAIGAVSLLVAAIGIANTMMMSIYERTREIGIIKVLGANISDIRKMFLLEAAMIGFGGGLMGVALSYLISFGLNEGVARIYGQQSMGGVGQMSVIVPELAIIAVIFATIIGVVSGYIPARRAMNLSALEAIRNE